MCLIATGNITVTKNCWLNEKSIASVSYYFCKCSRVTLEKVKTVCPSGKVHSFKTKQTKNVKSAFNCFEEGKNDNCSNCISCTETPSRDERKDRLRKLKSKLPVATTALTSPPPPHHTPLTLPTPLFRQPRQLFGNVSPFNYVFSYIESSHVESLRAMIFRMFPKGMQKIPDISEH